MTRDPSAGLEAAFRRIERERMQGVAMLNPALRVEALGFSRHGQAWLGILVSPWFVNTVIVPDNAEPAREGEAVLRRLASGTFAFLPGDEPEVGRYETCALCTRMDGFATQEQALEFAREALALLHRVPETASPPAESPLSKRQFLGAMFLRPR